MDLYNFNTPQSNYIRRLERSLLSATKPVLQIHKNILNAKYDIKLCYVDQKTHAHSNCQSKHVCSHNCQCLVHQPTCSTTSLTNLPFLMECFNCSGTNNSVKSSFWGTLMLTAVQFDVTTSRSASIDACDK